MRPHLDAGAALDRPLLETGAVIRKRIGPWCVLELYGYQELRRACVAKVGVEHLREVDLIPPMRSVDTNRVADECVGDLVAKRVRGAGQMPGKNTGRVVRVGDYCRIEPIRGRARRPRRAVDADQAVFAADFPVVAG